MFELPTQSLSFTLVIGPAFAWAVFAVAVLFYLLVSISLTHHWKKFAFEPGSYKTASRIYLTTTTLFIIIAATSFILYTLSIPQ